MGRTHEARGHGRSRSNPFSRLAVGGLVAASGCYADVPTNTLVAPTIATVEVTSSVDTLDAVGATAQFAATARDENGNAVPGQAFVWSSSDAAVASVDSTGRATAVANGDVTIRASVGAVSGSAGLTVEQRLVPGNATVTVPNGASGETTTVTVVGRDANGNAMTAGGAAVTVSVSGANTATPAVTDAGDGTYTASYTPVAVGTDTVAVTVDGAAVGATPLTSEVGPGAVSAAVSAATVPDGTAGAVTTITVDGRDANGNDVGMGGASVVVTVSGANSATPAVTDDGAGSYAAEYTPTVAGTDTVSITLNGTPVGAGSFTSAVAPGPVDAAASTGTVPDGASGDVTAIDIQGRDANGNAVVAGGAAVVVTVSGANAATPAVTDAGDGTYSATYTPTAAGTDTVTVTLDDSPIAGSPFASVVSPGAVDAAATTATVPNGAVGETTAIEIQGRDANGNDVAVGGATVVVTVTGANSATPVVSDGGEGTYTASYVPTASGTDNVAITLNGTAIGGSPYASTVIGAVTLTVFDGDGQTGLAGAEVNIPPRVRLVDENAIPVAGTGVTFAVTAGGGSVTGGSAVTDANGEAAPGGWVLGAAPGPNTVVATVDGSAASASFDATGITAQYDIDVRFTTPPSAEEQAAFDAAEAVWEQLVIGDVSNVPVNVAAGTCGSESPAVNETVDDLVIFATIDSIDGPGGILGSAGPCYIRSGSGLSIIGQMTFDVEDAAGLIASGQFEAVVLHEMGHILGIGTLWDFLGFLVNPSLPSSPGVDTYFNGPRAIAAFDALGGTSYTGGEKVPVENSQGGTGTRDGHWRESVFDNELMTGFLNGGDNPLSRMTTASLWDLGYLVNLSASDDYSQVFTLRAGISAGAISLGDDIRKGPVYWVGPSGAVVGSFEIR